MSAFTSFMEISSVKDKSIQYREWQLHTPDDLMDIVYQGNKVPSYMSPLTKGEHVVHHFFYDLDKTEGGDKTGWMVFKDGFFLGVEIVEVNEDNEESDYPEAIMKHKYGITSPRFHYNCVDK